MTHKEALEVIEKNDKCSQGDCPDVDSCVVCPYNFSGVEFREAYAMAIDALEKQIPKRPNYKLEDRFVKNHFVAYLYCPVCEKEVVAGDMHCVQCGQKIIWEE